jgi:signal transduction histidine kinase
VLGLIVIGSVLLIRNNGQKRKANKLLKQSYSNIELLEEIGRKITSSLSVKDIIGTVYTNVNALMDANVFGIGLYNDALKRIEFPSTYEKGEILPAYSNSIDDMNRFAPVCFNNNKEIIMGNLEEEYKDHVQEILNPHEGDQPHSLIFLPLVAKDKKLGVLTVQSFQKNAYTDYHVYMLRNIAIYTAIALDNASAYQELKSTQAQLIQSEKMASLGELTAGIAHEIQNPLNFVNNFSEVNNELIDEMKDDLAKGNIEEAKLIADNIKQNLDKINHHGKRADAIVKGMLQHSRSSSNQKEPTNINALADEYLRLAYHGLRAKDKTFNAFMKTDFDESIEKINIVPQDIGRVILNLITNAFYAVTEKKRSGIENYEPTVSISTKATKFPSGDLGVILTVTDNGNGIPQKVQDKIFQPFFTTKPTGSGTGLGLSLSYDIIKAHDGEIKVETEEGVSTAFIIQLPSVINIP